MMLTKERNFIPGLAPSRQTHLQMGLPATPVNTTAKCSFYVQNTSCVDMRLAWETRVLDAAARVMALDLSVEDGMQGDELAGGSGVGEVDGKLG